MKLFGVIALSALGVCTLPGVHAADPAKVDYTQQNAGFTPAASITPQKNVPQLNTSLQEHRVTPAVLDKKEAAVGDRRAAIDLTETRQKNVIEKESHRPETRERELSSFDHRESDIRTSTQVEKPPLVSRYQSSLTSASATNMRRFPALDQATGARINRFVFRKNEPSGPVPVSAPVIPAGRGATP